MVSVNKAWETEHVGSINNFICLMCVCADVDNQPIFTVDVNLIVDCVFSITADQVFHVFYQ